MELHVTDFRRGFLIVMEGGDGCGTTTHARLLADGLAAWLPTIGPDLLTRMGLNGEVSVLRGPSDSDFGRAIRARFEDGGFSSARAATMAFALDRLEQCNSTLGKLLDSGCVVIFDRYVHSSLVHQGMQGADAKFVIECNSDVPVPELIFHLQCDPRIASMRIVERLDDPMSRSKNLLAELEIQHAAWEAVWKFASHFEYPTSNFKPFRIDTGASDIIASAKRIHAEATATILERCMMRELA